MYRANSTKFMRNSIRSFILCSHISIRYYEPKAHKHTQIPFYFDTNSVLGFYLIDIHIITMKFVQIFKLNYSWNMMCTCSYGFHLYCRTSTDGNFDIEDNELIFILFADYFFLHNSDQKFDTKFLRASNDTEW